MAVGCDPASQLFGFSASRFSTAALEAAAHPHELEPEPRLYLHLDHRHMGVGGDTAWTRSVLPRYFVSPGTHRWAVRLRPFSGATPSHPLDGAPLPPELQAELTALPSYEPSSARCLRCGALLGLGWLALLLALLLAAPLLPLPAAVQLLLPGGDRYLPGGDGHLTGGGERPASGRLAAAHLATGHLAAASTTAPYLAAVAPQATQVAHALGRTDGTPGRWPTPTRGDNQREAAAEVPTPGGGGGRARRPAGRPAAAARAKLRSVASAAARRDTASNATRVDGGGGGGGGTRAPPAGGRKGLLLPLTGRDRRHVVQVRQHRLGLGA